jgi:hypothetical protein
MQKNQSGTNKATIKSMWSEVDETIQQQVRNIMTHQETQKLQEAYQGTTTWHEATDAYCKIGNIFPLSNPRAKYERSNAFQYFLLSIPVGYIYSELYKGSIKNVFKALTTSSSVVSNQGPYTLQNISHEAGNE